MRDLERLARMHGVQTAWRGAGGRVQRVAPDTLLAVLRVLGVELTSAEDAGDMVRAAREARRRRLLEPVLVAQGDAPLDVPLWPARGARARLDARLVESDHERGDGRELGRWSARLDAPPRSDARGRVLWRLPQHLAVGTYRLEVEVGGRHGHAHVIVAPPRAPELARGVALFASLAALHDPRTGAVGGFRELGRLARWAAGAGVDTVATLPVTAAEPDEASPYSPLSRRHWNERYLDRGPDAPSRAGVDTLVDPAAASRQVRRALASGAASMSAAQHARRAAYLRERPEVERYARWRAAREVFGGDWSTWPADALARAEPAAVELHRTAQWRCDEELGRLSDRDAGRGLFLDLPVGVRGDGFDVFAAPDEFLRGASVGAPPDAFFAGGQRWGFPPPHPERARERGHRDLALAIRAHARHARVLRLDHVLGLHRMWVVPDGLDARAGAYVRYPAEEQYAVLLVEAARAGCALVGEDLGTVPPRVRDALGEHGILRTVVLPFAAPADDPARIDDAPEAAVVALGTHDLPPFASFWTGRDLDEMEAREELDGPSLEVARTARREFRRAWSADLRRHGFAHDPEDPASVLRASLVRLARGPARLLVVQLEDLFGEVRRINAPGTLRPENWRARLSRSLDELEQDAELARFLRALARERAPDPPGDRSDAPDLRPQSGPQSGPPV